MVGNIDGGSTSPCPLPSAERECGPTDYGAARLESRPYLGRNLNYEKNADECVFVAGD
jgi:hypothetical protein